MFVVTSKMNDNTRRERVQDGESSKENTGNIHVAMKINASIDCGITKLCGCGVCILLWSSIDARILYLLCSRMVFRNCHTCHNRRVVDGLGIRNKIFVVSYLIIIIPTHENFYPAPFLARRVVDDVVRTSVPIPFENRCSKSRRSSHAAGTHDINHFLLQLGFDHANVSEMHDWQTFE